MKQLNLDREEAISLDAYLATCRHEVQVPITKAKVREVAASIEDVTFRRFRADSKDLLDSRLFAASDTDRDRTRWFASGDDVPFEERRLITYAELLGLPDLLRDYLERLRIDRAGRPDRQSPRMMTLHCSSCDARWMLDGNHGFVRICASGNHQPITVTEMTSPQLGMHGCAC